MFERIKEKRREIKELRQKQLESLPDYVSNPTLKKCVIPFAKLYPILLAIAVTIGLFIFPVVRAGQVGWAILMLYLGGFPITIAAIFLIYYLTFYFTKWAVIKLFISMFEKRREIKELRQKHLESLPDYVSTPTLKKCIFPFAKLCPLLLAIAVTIGLYLFPVVWAGPVEWVILMLYLGGFPITIAAIFLVYYLTFYLTKRAVIQLFISNNFDVKLLIIGILIFVILAIVTEFRIILDVYNF